MSDGDPWQTWHLHDEVTNGSERCKNQPALLSAFKACEAAIAKAEGR